jgi:hypothetical protein
MSSITSLSKGDFVEILAPHAEEGKRGYIFERAPFDPSSYRVLMDGFRHHDSSARLSQQYNPTQTPAVVEIVLNTCLKLIRKDGEVVTTSVCDLVSETYPCLGLIASKSKESKVIINPDSPHGKINRLAARDLSDLPSDLCCFKNQAGESIVRSIHSGAFVAKWVHTFQPEDISIQHQEWMLIMASPVLIIQVFIPLKTEVVVVVVVEEEDAGLQHVGYVILIPISDEDTNMQCNRMFEQTTQEQASWLALRTYHHLLRVTGNDIGCFTLWETRCAFKQYQFREIWKEKLDASTILADIMIQTKQLDVCCYFALELFGNALELCKKFRRAAAIYGQAGHEYATKLGDNGLLLYSYYNQGKALHRNKDFREAEYYYLRGLRELFATYKRQAFEHELFPLLTKEFPFLYVERDELVTGGASMKDLSFVLHAILGAAALLEDYLHPELALSQLLETKYTEKGAARLALMKAFTTSTVDDFRATVGSWKQPGTQVLSSVPGDVRSDKVKQFRQTTDARKLARDTSPYVKLLCFNPSCTIGMIEKSKLLQCGKCKDAFYCSRDCQGAHWKIHKHTCKPISSSTSAET